MISRPEKTLGILGGMGPAATAEFLRLLAVNAPADRDQEHPSVLMISEPSIPDRTDAILGFGDDPTEHLKKELNRLIGWGADVLAVPCNTAHYFIDRFRNELTVPLVHIVEATVESAQRRSPEGAWLLSTTGTLKSGLYSDYAHRANYGFLVPTETQQELVQQSLFYVKAGKFQEAGRILCCVIQDLWAKEDIFIVTACTELPLAYAASCLPKEMEISSLQALSDVCLEHLYDYGTA